MVMSTSLALATDGPRLGGGSGGSVRGVDRRRPHRARPTATLIDIDAVLDREEPFAFSGKPCDVGALRNLARQDERVGRLVRYWLTPVCGGYRPPDSPSDS